MADLIAESNEEGTQPPARQQQLPPRTNELLILLGLTLGGLVLRLAGLGQAPLSDAEASQALVAWHVYQPHGLVVGSPYSPVMTSLNVLMFWLIGASDFAARFGPALLGTLLIPLPYGLRRSLGKSGSIAASALLAFSPLFLFFSRIVNGEIATIFGSLTLLVGISNLARPIGLGRIRSGGWSALTALGAAVLLTASPATYSIVVIGVGGLLLVLTRKDAPSPLISIRQLLLVKGRSKAIDWTIILFVLVVLLATAGLFNYAGLSESADMVGSWIRGFRFAEPAGQLPGSPAIPVYPAIFSVALYEPLLLLAGLMGAAVAIVRRRPIDLLLTWWLFGGLTFDLLRPGRSDGEVLIALLPLVLLSGMALGRLWDTLRQDANWQREGSVALAGLVIAGYAYIQLMVYTRTGGTSWFLPVAAFILFIALIVVVWMLNDPYTALRSASVTLVICLSLLSIGTAVRLNYGPVVNPRQTVVTAPADLGVPELETTLKFVSSTRAKDPYLIGVVATRDSGPAVEWSLRRFPNVTWLDSASQLTPGNTFDDTVQAAIASSEAFVTPGTPQTDGTGYVGQDFAVRSTWSPMGLSGGETIRWLLLRTASTPVMRENVVLWVRQ